MLKHALISLMTTLLLAPSASIACMATAEFKISDVRRADIVIKARITDYEIVRGDPTYRARFGLITAKTLRTLVGERQKEWRFVWHNSTVALPESWSYGDVVFIAALSPDPTNKDPERSWYGDAGFPPGMPAVLQAACAEPFILPGDKDTMRRLKAALAAND